MHIRMICIGGIHEDLKLRCNSLLTTNVLSLMQNCFFFFVCLYVCAFVVCISQPIHFLGDLLRFQFHESSSDNSPTSTSIDHSNIFDE